MRNTNDHGPVILGGIAVVAVSALIAALGYGWIANIVAIAHANFSDITGLLVLRVIGVFVAPIGSVLGLFV